jgi:glucose/arabinose dehydrogenase
LIALLLRSVLFFLIFVLTTPSLAQQQYRIDTLARAPDAQYPSGIAIVQGGNGKFFFTEKNSGRVRLFDGTLRSEPFVTVPVDNEGEQGLLGIALHPAYPDTPYVFIYYVRAMDRLGIVERYVDSAGTGIRPAQIFIIPRMNDATEHNGGVLAFGPDGKLYIGVGDHRTQRAWVQDTTNRRSVWGKILRIDPDGSMPTDNPILRRPFWAWGLRNPQGLAFDHTTGDLYCTDGGFDGVNAVYLVRKGDNLGWPATDRTRFPATTLPLFAFSVPNQPALTGIAVYHGDAFPKLHGKVLFCANAIPAIWSCTPGVSTLHVDQIFSYPSGFADMQEGPDGYLYLTNGPYISSKIIRIMPVAPSFTSPPPSGATQGMAYVYQPMFDGTPPDVRLLYGPEGMICDEVTGTVTWIPTNEQVLRGPATFVLEARNGAGTAEQRRTVSITNVNDPPNRFALERTVDREILSFSGSNPELTLHWERGGDPDGDTLQYIVEVDTSIGFKSPAYHLFLADTADSIHITLPHPVSVYYWRVTANDGRLTTTAEPPYGRIAIAYLTPPVERPQRTVVVDTPPPVLEQNYPNPFNPSTSISYTVRHAGHVKLSVFNLLGQEIARVFEGNQPEGTYDVAFNKLNLPSGIYFYRLQAPGIFETKKMIIAR